MELDKIKKLIADEFRNQKGLVAVLLYGSYARGTPRPTSDVDIAVLYSSEETIPDAISLWELQCQLRQKLSMDVDLICLNKADPIIGNQIYRNHLPVIVKEPTSLAEYFVLLSSEYAELKEFIRPMEGQILKRKYAQH